MGGAFDLDFETRRHYSGQSLKFFFAKILFVVVVITIIFVVVD
jgi:hypothetical protein